MERYGVPYKKVIPRRHPPGGAAVAAVGWVVTWPTKTPGEPLQEWSIGALESYPAAGVVATAAGLAAAAVWGWRVYLARPVNMAHHPFVRFPAAATAVAAGVAVLVRHESPVWWVLLMYGGVFLTSHFLHLARQGQGRNPPPLPEYFGFSGWPGTIALGYGTLQAVGFCFDLVDSAWNFLGLAQAFQVSYGVYFVLCHLVTRREPQLSNVALLCGLPLTTGVGNFWKSLGVGGRATLIGTTGAAAVGTTTGVSTHRLRTKEIEHKAKELDHQIQLDNRNLSLRERNLLFKQQKHADLMQTHYDTHHAGYRRVGNHFDNVSYPSRWVTPPRQVVSTPPKVSDPPHLSSPLEDFTGWVPTRWVLWVGSTPVDKLAGLLAGVAAAGVVLRLLRGWSPSRTTTTAAGLWAGWFPRRGPTMEEVYGKLPPVEPPFWDPPGLLVCGFITLVVVLLVRGVAVRIRRLWAALPLVKVYLPDPPLVPTPPAPPAVGLDPAVSTAVVEAPTEPSMYELTSQAFLPVSSPTAAAVFTLHAGLATLAAAGVMGGLYLWACPYSSPTYPPGEVSVVEAFRRWLRRFFSFFYHRVGGFTLVAGATLTLGVGLSYGVGVHLGHYHGPLNLYHLGCDFFHQVIQAYRRARYVYHALDTGAGAVQEVLGYIHGVEETGQVLSRMADALGDNMSHPNKLVFVVLRVRRGWIQLGWFFVWGVAVALVVDHLFFREVVEPHFTYSAQLAYQNACNSKVMVDQLEGTLRQLRLTKPCIDLVHQCAAEDGYEAILKDVRVVHRANVILYNELTTGVNKYLAHSDKLPFMERHRLSYLERGFAQATRLWRSSIG